MNFVFLQAKQQKCALSLTISLSELIVFDKNSQILMINSNLSSRIDRDPGEIPVPVKISLFAGIPVPVKIMKFTGISTGILYLIFENSILF